MTAATDGADGGTGMSGRMADKRKTTGATDAEIAEAGGVYVGIETVSNITITCGRCGATSQHRDVSVHRVVGRIAPMAVLTAIGRMLAGSATFEDRLIVRSWMEEEAHP
jgi:hypothetical protein